MMPKSIYYCISIVRNQSSIVSIEAYQFKKESGFER